MPRDIKSVRLLYLKAALFVVMGLITSLLLLIENPTLRTTLLLGVTIWAFCRAYYFVFYVIEHYADPQFKFAGLWSFACYCCSRPGR